MHLKQFWQSLALNVTSESSKFSPIPAGMVTLKLEMFVIHAKQGKSLMLVLKIRIYSFENTDCGVF